VDPRAAQCIDPDHHQPHGRIAWPAAGILIERFFSIPGIGREVILAVERSDFPVIKAITVYVAFATIITNLLADLMYKAVDPRVQLK
jgi:ABC-type dipeptide/oligopeptide/nickel transport system permease component